jgi:hypothetical protein
MNYPIADYTFLGLKSDDPVTTLAYLIALVDSDQNAIVDPAKAKLVLRWLFDIEEQVESASELLIRQEENRYFPKGYHPQSPVMLAPEWSPIAAMLEHGWEPFVLVREMKRRACASGIWRIKAIETNKPGQEFETPQKLFWHVLGKAAEKAKIRGLLISVIAMPGWSYKSNIGRPCNLTLAEAEKADRVVWQRTPNK